MKAILISAVSGVGTRGPNYCSRFEARLITVNIVCGEY